MDDSQKLDEIIRRIKKIEAHLGITQQEQAEAQRRQQEFDADKRGSGLASPGYEEGSFGD